MSNTGYKGISASLDADNQPWRFQVFLGWKNEERRTQIYVDERGPDFALQEALTQRKLFEDDLNKPHTEELIRPARGIYRMVGKDGPFWRAQFFGKQRTFSIGKYGERKAKNLAKAALDEMREAIGWKGNRD